MTTNRPRPVIHGRDHAAGGADPIPGGIPIEASSTFEEASGFLTITSTNFSSPTSIITSDSFVADGSTYKIEFYVATVDISVTGTGTGTSLNLQLLIDSTILGIVSNYNVVPTNGIYGSIPIYIAVFDTPSTGTHTYSIGGVKGLTGGATATMRVFGSNAGSPFDTVTHPGFIAVSKVVTI